MNTNDNEDQFNTACTVVQLVPGKLLMQAMCQFINAYVLAEFKSEDRGDTTEEETKKNLSLEGIIEHYAELLNLSEIEKDVFKNFLMNPAVKTFTQFPVDFEGE